MNKINKTIILLATAASFYAPISFADAEQFYVKANAGYSKLTDARDREDDKFKSKHGNFFFGLGVGYNLTDKVRMDLVFDHFESPVHIGSIVDQVMVASLYTKVKGNINALTINGYINLFDENNIRIFTGAGIGISQIKATAVDTFIHPTKGKTYGHKYKRSNNFAYALHLGASAKISDNLHTDFTYSRRGFGRAQENEDQKGNSFAYRGNHLTLGIRYDI